MRLFSFFIPRHYTTQRCLYTGKVFQRVVAVIVCLGMKLFFTRTITTSLLFMLSMCCLLLVALAGCTTTSPHLQILKGNSCAAEQTSLPVASTIDTEQPATVIESIRNIILAASGFFLFLSLSNIFQIILKVGPEKIIRLIRSGPISKKTYLPYTLGTHGG